MYTFMKTTHYLNDKQNKKNVIFKLPPDTNENHQQVPRLAYILTVKIMMDKE